MKRIPAVRPTTEGHLLFDKHGGYLSRELLLPGWSPSRS